MFVLGKEAEVKGNIIMVDKVQIAAPTTGSIHNKYLQIQEFV